MAYEELIVFDDTNISGLSSILKDNKDEKTQVLDWFEINQGSNTPLDYIKTDDNFVKDIFLYKSKRPKVKPGVKDLVAISYMTPNEAKYDYQNSDTYARFKILKTMKEAGVKGPKNGKNPNYPDRSSEPFKWLSPKITFVTREIFLRPCRSIATPKRSNFAMIHPNRLCRRTQ